MIEQNNLAPFLNESYATKYQKYENKPFKTGGSFFDCNWSNLCNMYETADFNLADDSYLRVEEL